MNVFQVALLCGAIIAAALSWREPRGVAWIVAGATSFVLTAGYEAGGGLYHPIVTLFCDLSVCALVAILAAYRWEFYLFLIFLASALTSLIMSTLLLAGMSPSHELYIILLEAWNWTALLVIGGTGLGELVDDWMGDRWGRVGALHRLLVHLRTPIKAPFG